MTDSRARRFVARHGDLVQVEALAIEPQTLRDLYQSALDRYWDQSHYDEVVEATAERSRLVELADGLVDSRYDRPRGRGSGITGSG